MPRPSTWTLLVLPLLVLSLAYFAQSYVSSLGPAPHLGSGITLYSVALSSLIGYARAAMTAPFHTKVLSGPEVQVPLTEPHSEGFGVEVELEAPCEGTGDGDVDVDPRPKFKRRIVAVGDIHGDLVNAHRVLQMANVVDEDGYWTGDVDVFVQTGDIIDRYATLERVRVCKVDVKTEVMIQLTYFSGWRSSGSRHMEWAVLWSRSLETTSG